MPSSSVSRETPRQRVPSLDHWVTQWMSVVMSSAGSAVNCFQSHLVVSPVSVVTVNVQVAVLTGGVGPAWRTGKPCSRYWPGGSFGRPAVASGREAARDDVHELSFVRQSAGTRPAGPGTGWSAGWCCGSASAGPVS